MTQTPPPPPVQSATPSSNSTAATIALVLGIIGLAASIILIGGAIGVVAVIVGIVALLNIKKSNGQLLGRKKALLGIALGALAIPASLAAFAVIFVLLLAPARERAREALVAANMHTLQIACLTYSAQNNDMTPPHLSTLYLDGDFSGSPRFFVDPRSGKTPPALSPTMTPAQIAAEVDAHCDFVYTYGWDQFPPGGARAHAIKESQLSPNDIMFYAKIPARKKIIACFADGHVEHVTPEDLTANLRAVNKTRELFGLDPLPQSVLTPPQ